MPAYAPMPRLNLLPALLLSSLLLGFAQESIHAAEWHYSLPIAGTKDARAYLWLPPKAPHIRGLIFCGQTLIEKEFSEDKLIREAATQEGLGILFMNPSYDALFNYKEKSADKILDQLLKDLAELSGYSELIQSPFLTAGHSTAGHFARNVGYWNPGRCIGILHIKSGNLRPPESDPGASISGIPFLAINGQFEEFGPDGGIPPGDTHERQWLAVRDSISSIRKKDPKNLMALLVEPGAGHFTWSERLSKLTALFIRKAAQARLPKEPPSAGAAPVLREVPAESGWLGDADLSSPKRQPAAPYKEYKGDASAAFWWFDQEIAQAAEALHQLGGKEQMVTWVFDGKASAVEARPNVKFTPLEDGCSFKVGGDFVATVPPKFPNEGQPLGHASGPVCFRVLSGPVEQTGPDTFRIQFERLSTTKPGSRLTLLAYHPGDATYRYCEQPGVMKFNRRTSKTGKAQLITFTAPGNAAPGAELVLSAKSDSGLPVTYYVEYGPAEIKDGKLKILELPQRTKFPVKVCVLATQPGTGGATPILPAEPVEQIVNIEAK